MLLNTRKLISDSTIYGFGNILTKIVAFLLIPLYTRKLMPEEYGIVGILELIELIGKSVLVFGLGQSILRFFGFYERRGKLGELIFSSYFFVSLINLILLGLLFMFPDIAVRELLSLSPKNVLYFKYTLIIIYLSIFQAIFLIILQAERKALVFIIYTLIEFLLLVGLNIYKVGFRNEGVLGIVESKLYVAILSFILVNFYVFSKFKVRFSRTILKQGLRFGIPLIFVGISMTVLTLADRYFLKIYRDMAEVGIYTVSYKLGMIMNIILVTPFRRAFMPMIFGLADLQDLKKEFKKYLTYFLFAGFVFFLALSIFAKEILLIVTREKYVAGYIVVPFITFSYILFGMRTIYATVLSTQKKTDAIAYSSIIGAILNIILNIILIPDFGIIGAAIATLISYFCTTVVTYIPAQKLYHVPWDWIRIIKLTAVGLGLFFFSLLVTTNNIYLAIFIKFLLFLLFPSILYFSQFFKEEELSDIKSILKKISPGRIFHS